MKPRYSLILCVLFLLLLLPNSIVRPHHFTAPEWAVEMVDIISESRRVVEAAVEILSDEPRNLSPETWFELERIFNPSGLGELDDQFLDELRRHYVKILNRLNSGVNVLKDTGGSGCRGMRLYYTQWGRIYVCPYFDQEPNSHRKVRDLVHEVAHMTLMAFERPYYNSRTFSTRYQALSPMGPWFTEIPVLGYFLREVLRSDTLYHPDAHAWFAAQLVYPEFRTADWLKFIESGLNP